VENTQLYWMEGDEMIIQDTVVTADGAVTGKEYFKKE